MNDSVAIKVAVIGSVVSPFISVKWLQYVVWLLTAIAAVVSILANWNRAMETLFGKKQRRERGDEGGSAHQVD